jgi:hypothetical protein
MLKNKPPPIWKLLAVALLVSMSGCAAAYHDYPSCCIPYLYCTPPPLPHVAYEGCHCPTPGASLYSLQHGPTGTAIPESYVLPEAPTPPEQKEPVSDAPQ